MQNFLENFLAILRDSSAVFLLGLFLAACMKAFIPLELFKKHLEKQDFWSILKVTLMGIPMPLCSCAVLPSAISLKKNKASNGAVSAFLVATPEIGVDSFLLSYRLMGMPFTLLRGCMALTCAFGVGLFQFFFNKVVTEGNGTGHSHPKEKDLAPHKSLGIKFLEALRYSFGKLMNDLALWLLIGLIFSALVQTLLPDNFFSSYSAILTKIFILVIGIPLYICASASTPMALALMSKGLSPGNAMLLLLVGPATNLTNIMVMRKYIGTKGVAINILTITGVGLIFSFGVDYYFQLFPYSWSVHPAHIHAQWHTDIPSFILLLLIAKGIYYEHFHSRKGHHHHGHH